MNDHTYLHDETIKVPGVIVHDDPASITDHLTNTSEHHQNRECALLVPYSLDHVYDAADSEESNEDTSRGEIWSVLEEALLDTAFAQIAFSPASGRHLGGFVIDINGTNGFWRSDD